MIHVSSWAKRFLFRYEQLDRPVGELSGGEQARVLIARLMLTPADVLILDEPTNDLDIPSLEVLEESLDEFPGALVLVTHDRFMLDRLVDRNPRPRRLRRPSRPYRLRPIRKLGRDARKRTPAGRRDLESSRRAAAGITSPAKAEKKSTKKLPYKEQQELDTIEARVLEAEQDVQRWHKAMETPEVATDRTKLAEVCDKLHTRRNESSPSTPAGKPWKQNCGRKSITRVQGAALKSSMAQAAHTTAACPCGSPRARGRCR